MQRTDCHARAQQRQPVRLDALAQPVQDRRQIGQPPGFVQQPVVNGIETNGG